MVDLFGLLDDVPLVASAIIALFDYYYMGIGDLLDSGRTLVIAVGHYFGLEPSPD